MAGNQAPWRQAIKNRCIARIAGARRLAARSAGDYSSDSPQLWVSFPTGVKTATAAFSKGILSAHATCGRTAEIHVGHCCPASRPSSEGGIAKRVRGVHVCRANSWLLQWWRGSRSRGRGVEPNYARLVGIEVALSGRARRYRLSGDRVQIPTDTATRRRRIWGIAGAVLVREAVAALNASSQ